MSTTDRQHVGAVRAGEGRTRRRPAWLLWLLGLLVLAAIIALLIALLSGGDDKKKASAAAGSLKSGSTALLPVSSGGLKPLAGKDVNGQSVVVQSVVKGEGFWVGTSKTDRVYVEYGGAAGKAEGGFHPDRAGQKVDLDGPVKPAPANPAKTLKLGGRDAQLVKSEGAFINANHVAQAK